MSDQTVMGKSETPFDLNRDFNVSECVGFNVPLDTL